MYITFLDDTLELVAYFPEIQTIQQLDYASHALDIHRLLSLRILTAHQVNHIVYSFPITPKYSHHIGFKLPIIVIQSLQMSITSPSDSIKGP